MKKQNIISTIIVTSVMLITALVSLFYLPAELAVQWNESGVSSTASKFLVLAFPVLSAIFLVLHSQKSKESTGKFDFVSLLVSLLLFAAQSIITLNALEYINMMSLNYQFLQTIALLVAGLTICICGNHIPKFVLNFHCGVKAAYAYSNSDLWTKTQRFSGKLWFVSGLAIMLLSFVHWKGVSILVLCIFLCIILIPRVYSKVQYNKDEGAKR